MHAAIQIRRAGEEDALALSVLAEKTFRDAFADSNTAANMQLHCAVSYGQSMVHVLARAKAAGTAVLWLGVWDRNPRALAFYRNWSFDVVGDHIFTVGEDPQRDLIMCRDARSDQSVTAMETGAAYDPADSDSGSVMDVPGETSRRPWAAGSRVPHDRIPNVLGIFRHGVTHCLGRAHLCGNESPRHALLVALNFGSGRVRHSGGHGHHRLTSRRNKQRTQNPCMGRSDINWHSQSHCNFPRKWATRCGANKHRSHRTDDSRRTTDGIENGMKVAHSVMRGAGKFTKLTE